MLKFSQKDSFQILKKKKKTKDLMKRWGIYHLSKHKPEI
jgi:hypothetical protein